MRGFRVSLGLYNKDHLKVAVRIEKQSNITAPSRLICLDQATSHQPHSELHFTHRPSSSHSRPSPHHHHTLLATLGASPSPYPSLCAVPVSRQLEHKQLLHSLEKPPVWPRKLMYFNTAPRAMRGLSSFFPPPPPPRPILACLPLQSYSPDSRTLSFVVRPMGRGPSF